MGGLTLAVLLAFTLVSLPLAIRAVAATSPETSSLAFEQQHAAPASVATTLKPRPVAKPAPQTSGNLDARSPQAWLLVTVAAAVVLLVEGAARRRALLRIYRL